MSDVYKGDIAGKEFPAPSGNAAKEKMLDPHARQHPAHYDGTNSTSAETRSNPDKGKLGAKGITGG